LRPVIHPYYTKYAALQTLCLRILRYEKLSYGTANDNKIHGLLIDAAWLWEEYVGRVLAEKRTGLAHYTRSSRFHLLQTTEGEHFQQVIPDYYDEERKLVADAKYIPLHRYDHLDAERAAAVYYKTIMYMYRFNTNVGFLFHPCSHEDAEKAKNNTELSHLEIEKNRITCSYKIEDREDCQLHEVGMIIPQLEGVGNFSSFKNAMEETETLFVEKIENLIKPTKS
jgi:5-methylcytosine-specific restriction endonuclease McrBC regulatory subunit McrC